MDKPMVDCWLNLAKEENCTHLIVVFDLPENDTFPIYVGKSDDVYDIKSRYDNGIFKVLEIYNMNLDIDEQFDSPRSYNL